MGTRRSGLVAGLVAAAAFATSGPVIKPLLEAGWTPGGAILARLTIGAVLLAGPALHVLRGRYHLLRAQWRMLLLFGTVCVGGCSTLYYLAVDRLPVAVALLVEYTAPLMLLGLAWVRGRRTPRCSPVRRSRPAAWCSSSAPRASCGSTRWAWPSPRPPRWRTPCTGRSPRVRSRSRPSLWQVPAW